MTSYFHARISIQAVPGSRSESGRLVISDCTADDVRNLLNEVRARRDVWTKGILIRGAYVDGVDVFESDRSVAQLTRTLAVSDAYSGLQPLGDVDVKWRAAGMGRLVTGEFDAWSVLRKELAVPTEFEQMRRSVFVVHGRDEKVREATFNLLRAFDLRPLEWSDAIAMTGKASPFIGEVIATGLKMAQAVVVVLTGDEDVKLREGIYDPASESDESGRQARPNVFFEAGMAMGMSPDRTVILEVGNMRPVSDLFGRHVVRLRDDVKSRKAVGDRLATSGCKVNFQGNDWMTAGHFA